MKTILKSDAVLTNSKENFAPLVKLIGFFSDMGQHAKMMSERVVYDLGWPFQTAAIRSMNWNAKTYLDNNNQRLFCKKIKDVKKYKQVVHS